LARIYYEQNKFDVTLIHPKRSKQVGL